MSVILGASVTTPSMSYFSCHQGRLHSQSVRKSPVLNEYHGSTRSHRSYKWLKPVGNPSSRVENFKSLSPQSMIHVLLKHLRPVETMVWDDRETRQQNVHPGLFRLGIKTTPWIAYHYSQRWFSLSPSSFSLSPLLSLPLFARPVRVPIWLETLSSPIAAGL